MGNISWIILFLVVVVSAIQVAICTSPELEDEAADIIQNAIDENKKIKDKENKAALRPILEDKVSRRINAFLGSTPGIKKKSFPARIQLDALKELRKRTGLKGPAFWDKAREMFGSSVLKRKVEKTISKADRTVFGDDLICPDKEINCDKDYLYRSFDGTCNDLKNPKEGSAETAYVRWLPSAYADDIEEMRKDLPNARKVSSIIHCTHSEPQTGVTTLLHMTLGQILDHDIDRTAVSKFMNEETGELVDFECGEDGCTGEQGDDPEFAECEPIEIPESDEDFTKPCLMFVRSQEFLPENCELDAREQANSITGWLDASFTYGSNKGEADYLRDLSDQTRGKLKTSAHPFHPEFKPFMPTQDDNACSGITDEIQCFKSGDARQNEQIALTALHTMFVRLHNKFEEKLHEINGHWDGEKLFQETRRVVIASWQNIVFQEYLPVLLGDDLMEKYGLKIKKPGKYRGYSSKINAHVSNQFATASFRFGHSQIPDKFILVSRDYLEREELSFCQVLFNPTQLYEKHFGDVSGIDAVMHGNAWQPADNADRFFSKEMSLRLFTETPPFGHGSDLAARNIQRGRDHGLQGYNAWRKFCGLSEAASFDDLTDMPADARQLFADLYNNTDDIDLFAGAMAENHVTGGIVGPLFGCLIGKQFQVLKDGDRFWFENMKKTKNGKLKNPHGFSKDQIKEIIKFTTGRLYCDTLDEVERIQPNAMLIPIKNAHKSDLYVFDHAYKGDNNKRKPCKAIKSIDFGKWKEEK